MSVTRRCVIRIRIWPPKRDQRSGVLIGAGGTWRSDWPELLAFAREALESSRAKSSVSLHSTTTSSSKGIIIPFKVLLLIKNSTIS